MAAEICTQWNTARKEPGDAGIAVAASDVEM
jgi:hypothetical protein